MNRAHLRHEVGEDIVVFYSFTYRQWHDQPSRPLSGIFDNRRDTRGEQYVLISLSLNTIPVV